MLKRLDDIEQGVNSLKMPLAFAEHFYVLRGHIRFVRERLLAQPNSRNDRLRIKYKDRLNSCYFGGQGRTSGPEAIPPRPLRGANQKNQTEEMLMSGPEFLVAVSVP